MKENFEETPMARGLIAAYIKLYPGKADAIQNAIKQARETGQSPQDAILMVL